MTRLAASTIGLVLLGMLAACGGTTSSSLPPQGQAAPTLPSIDTAGAQALLGPDEILQAPTVPAGGSTTTSGSVVGYQSTAFAVPVAAGQTLTVEFEASTANLAMNIHDSRDQSGAAVFRGEVDGTRAVLTPSQPTTYLIRPFQPRATARRGERGDFSIRMSRS